MSSSAPKWGRWLMSLTWAWLEPGLGPGLGTGLGLDSGGAWEFSLGSVLNTG